MTYDIFCLHNIWNFSEVNFIMGGDKEGTVYFSILRDPVEQFISIWDYVGLSNDYLHISLEEYALVDKTEEMYKDRKKFANWGTK